MKADRILVSAVFLCFVLFVAGCSSISVSTDFDSETDFTELSTYSWLQNPETVSEDVQKELAQNTLIEDRVKRAVEDRLAEKGIRKTTQDPDMLVAFHTGVEDKVNVLVWGYGYRHAAFSRGTDMRTVYHQEGSLILDFIDPKTKKLIWRGVATKVLSENPTPAKSEKEIDEAVQEMLKQYPPS